MMQPPRQTGTWWQGSLPKIVKRGEQVRIFQPNREYDNPIPCFFRSSAGGEVPVGLESLWWARSALPWPCSDPKRTKKQVQVRVCFWRPMSRRYAEGSQRRTNLSWRDEWVYKMMYLLRRDIKKSLTALIISNTITLQSTDHTRLIFHSSSSLPFFIRYPILVTRRLIKMQFKLAALLPLVSLTIAAPLEERIPRKDCTEDSQCAWNH